jgi:hypothetical protein
LRSAVLTVHVDDEELIVATSTDGAGRHLEMDAAAAASVSAPPLEKARSVRAQLGRAQAGAAVAQRRSAWLGPPLDLGLEVSARRATTAAGQRAIPASTF